MTTKTRLWFKSLIASVIGGAANAGTASLGIQAGNMLGLKIQPLDIKQLGSICLSGAIIGLLFYLKQSPVPPDNGDTTIVTKTQTVSVTTPKDETKTP